MQQQDMFEETLDKKIRNMEKWMCRLQKEMFFLKNVYNMHQRQQKFKQLVEEKQPDMFAG